MLKAIFVIALSFVIQIESCSQEIDELFNSLEVPFGWKKSLSTDTTFQSFYDKGKVGRITMTRGSRVVRIIIFDNSVNEDSVFKSNLIDYNASSSCSNYRTKEPYSVFSFSWKNYFVLPELCPKCDFYNDRKCKKLLKNLFYWSSEMLTN